MGLFKKKPTITPQQVLLQQFPRTVNSLSKRIHIVVQGISKHDLQIKEHDQDIMFFRQVIADEISDLRAEVFELQTKAKMLDETMTAVLKIASDKATVMQLDRLKKLVDAYDPGEYVSKRAIGQLL